MHDQYQIQSNPLILHSIKPYQGIIRKALLHFYNILSVVDVNISLYPLILQA